GAFAYSTTQILKNAGASVSTYLTRNYGHYAPSLSGPTYHREQFPSPCPLLKGQGADLIVPMSIDWAQAPWKEELLGMDIPIFGPTGEGMRLERERDFARKLCHDFKIPFPLAYVARNRLEAEQILEKHPHPFVIKNPLCSPTSPIHTILCETLEDTRSWLRHIDYAEGVFLQEYLGPCEAGHIALVSGGEIYSLVTNQEYKRAFAGNMGVIAGAPLGGLVEIDPQDKYGLARELLHPLLPWFRQVNYHGPVQVTAVRRKNQWHVIEYNIRIGVTSGAMILRLLANPLETLLHTGQNKKLAPKFLGGSSFGCSVTLAGYGYPYVQVRGPQLPVEVTEAFDCDVWWNEVTRDAHGRLLTTGPRIADVIGFGATLEEAAAKAYANIRKIRCLGSYYRPDIGQSLWPPGNP
ncbi:MAG TPA: phosphoribosylglycinamide synthetase C domain-containing protein, partial [Candidatus Sulfotelmatobacter sp.]|nr:phosphoribosylglycinamide synthetase C domain-containing protein [Candidatus Sulfotelmatobacter sp.]